jgi:cyanophycin synthetase
VRLIEIRMLEGPNVYALEPTVKLEVMVGRRRTWYGQRLPGRHAVVHLGASVSERDAPLPVVTISGWVRYLHAATGAAAWLSDEGRVSSPSRARIPVALHRSSDPGHWIVAWPWRERERAEAIAEHAYRLVELGVDPGRVRGGRRSGAGGSRSLARALRAIAEADATPPPWIRDGERSVPCVSISGTNGKSTTTRMLSHILRMSGRHVGTTTSDGVLFDEQLVEAGDLTGPAGARSVFENPAVEVAVLETARGGIVLKGIGYESNEASILTNVSPDHLDLQGIHTLPELAEVKATVARITKPTGVAVLNAEDPLVAALARRVRARVCYFSLDPGNARVRWHVARGGLAVVLDADWLVELDGAKRHRIVRVGEVPATILGLARHNIANALAAGAAARALSATIEQVAEGLRTFQPTADQAPGRLNFYRLDQRLVIVDFAHNEAGVNVVMDVAEGLVGRRDERAGRAFLTIIIGTAGDRPDDSLRGIGRIAAERADQVAIKETLRYLRGRTRQSMIGEFQEGIRSGGGRLADVPVYEDEAGSVRGELTNPARLAGGGTPGVLVIMCHADREAVVATITELGGVAVSSMDGLRVVRDGA